MFAHKSMSRPVQSIMTVLWAVAFPVLFIAVSTDTAEIVWKQTRLLEWFQFDEMLLTIGTASIIGLILALKKILLLKNQIEKLEMALIDAKQKAMIIDDQSDD